MGSSRGRRGAAAPAPRWAMVVTPAEEVADASVGTPHVVLLGAGASRAACPAGDGDGRRLPLMALRAGTDWLTDFEEAYAEPQRTPSGVASSRPGSTRTSRSSPFQTHRRFTSEQNPALRDVDLLTLIDWFLGLREAETRAREEGRINTWFVRPQ